MESINWGIIGCGDVTEIKSGPAFNKVKNSKLVAVMRRNAGEQKIMPKDIMYLFGIVMLMIYFITKILMLYILQHHHLII